MTSDVKYLLQRASEETILSMYDSDPAVAESRRKLAIQLIVLARHKTANPDDKFKTPPKKRLYTPKNKLNTKP